MREPHHGPAPVRQDAIEAQATLMDVKNMRGRISFPKTAPPGPKVSTGCETNRRSRLAISGTRLKRGIEAERLEAARWR